MYTHDINTLNLLRFSIWGTGSFRVDKTTYEELKLHTVVAIPAPILEKLDIPSDLYDEWKATILQQVSRYCRCEYAEKSIPITVPYVILKGSSASQYYEYPQYRLMGDIDIMTSHQDFDIAYAQLLNNGYKCVKKLDREYGFVKNGIMVELHRYYASLNDPKQAKYLDDLVIDNISPTHFLPDMINGLVLLEHINQHLENGIGLRQIIDWMMFVSKCLPDEKWEDFCPLACNIGLEKLAITVTRMCEIYLGLPTREWSASANLILCNELMEFILSCGNFGVKWTHESGLSEKILTRVDSPKAAIILLQRKGLVNWNTASRFPVLRPFAWIYQLGKYFSIGMRRNNPFSKLYIEFRNARKIKRMFDELGIKQSSKGLAIYKNGEYTK